MMTGQLPRWLASMGEQEDYKTFIERSQNYINVFDPTTKFMRGRFRNTWFAPF